MEALFNILHRVGKGHPKVFMEDCLIIMVTNKLFIDVAIVMFIVMIIINFIVIAVIITIIIEVKDNMFKVLYNLDY